MDRRRSSCEPRWLDPPLQRMEDIQDAAMDVEDVLYLKGEELQSKFSPNKVKLGLFPPIK